jgi:ATP-binding cassette subfamily F protein 3
MPGGYRTRVKLAAMLLQDPDFLVLDEPTNFLDLSTVLLLQDFLASFRGGAIVVSHDREFLKATCDHTLLVERGGLTLYPGPVEEFFAWQAEQIEVARRTNETMQARRQELQDFVNRFRAKASKASQAQSKMKQIARLQPITIANPLATVRIHIPQVERRNGLAMAGEDLSIGYPDKVIANEISFGVDRGEKVAIVGDNGQGKTTLLRTLAGDLPERGGRVRHGHGIEISYYAQHVYQALHPADTVFTHLESSADSDVSRQEILAMAGSLLFRGDDVDKPVGVLSGGERARVCLGGLLLARRSVLVLDEPTNHLDFETVEALGAALREFAGTVLFVSHDRTFVNMAATQIVEVHEGRVRTLAGSYADYVEDLQLRARKSTAPAKTKTKAGGEDAKAAHAARRKLRNERKRAQRALADLEPRIERLQAERTDIAARISTAGDDAGAMYVRLSEIDTELSTAETEWLEHTETIERAEQA